MSQNDDIAQLRARLQDVERRLASVVEAVNSLAGIAADVTALSERLGEPGRARPTGSPRPSWFTADTDHAVTLLTDLTTWIADVLVRYTAAREALPPCWMLHGEVVEELLWLRDAWTDAYQSPDPGPVGDWHERRMPGVMNRIRRYPGQNCTYDEHHGTAGAGYRLRDEHDPHDRLPRIEPEAAAAYARWWVHTRGLGPAAPPTPGASQRPS
nr:hypothetical protein GCM10020063_001670 [Dactylosporangium thailandense]